MQHCTRGKFSGGGCAFVITSFEVHACERSRRRSACRGSSHETCLHHAGNENMWDRMLRSACL